VSQESTTPDPVEGVRRAFEALRRRDVDEFMSTWTPDAVWDLNAWGIGSFEGLAAIRGFVEDWLGNYEDYLAEAEEIFDLGDGVVFVAYREFARPLGSEGNLERRQAQVLLSVEGRPRSFFGYAARGTSFIEVRDDGTLAPTAVGGSVPFAPEITIPTLITMRERYGERLFGRYGFLDAFNPSFTATVPVSLGRVFPGEGWFDTDYLGIDEGPILAMIENYRSELVWRVMRRNPHVLRGLRRAGFSGGWLDQVVAVR